MILSMSIAYKKFMHFNCFIFLLEVSALTKTPPPAIDTNSTAATVLSPLTSVLVPKSTSDNQHVPVSEGQAPMDLVSQSGNIDQSRVPSPGEIHVTNNILHTACILLVISVQAFPILN
jgi:hypothetical protein